MRILRSQYLKLATTETGGDNNSDISLPDNRIVEKQGIISSKRNNGSYDQLRSGSTDLATLNTSTDPVGTNIKLLLENIDDSIKNLNIVVEFTSMDSLWLTRVYRTYENDLWYRKPRLNLFGKNKWFYYCNLCNSVEYRTYCSIKSHLNGHLKFYPYVCKLCCKKYTNRKMATRHLNSVHKIIRTEWNDYLTS